MSSFTDGLSNTIIVGEVLPNCDAFKTWVLGNGTWSSTHAPINYKPAVNQPFNNWPNQIGFRCQHPGGANFLVGDGSVKFLKETINRGIYAAVEHPAGRRGRQRRLVLRGVGRPRPFPPTRGTTAIRVDADGMPRSHTAGKTTMPQENRREFLRQTTAGLAGVVDAQAPARPRRRAGSPHPPTSSRTR